MSKVSTWLPVGDMQIVAVVAVKITKLAERSGSSAKEEPVGQRKKT